jgi:methyl-accepting chemotaxis protein
MIRLNLRIGTKLGISAGVGVALVASMVISQQIAGGSVARAVADADRQDEIARSLLAAERDFQIVRGLNRGLRLATSVDEVGKFFDQVKIETGNAVKNIDNAMRNATEPGKPEGIVEGKAQVGDYLAAVTEIVAARRETFGLIAKRHENDAAWSQQYRTLMGSSELAGAEQRHELEAELRLAAEAYAEGRVAAWRFMALGESGTIAQLDQANEQAVAALTRARSAAGHKAMTEAIDGLMRTVAESKGISDQIFAVGTRQAQIEREPATVAAKQAVAMLGKAAGLAVRQSKAKGEQARAEIIHAGFIGFAVGAFVIVVLIGSALFGALSIGRPIRRISMVLHKLASGDKEVDVPYTARGDEVGDAAQAANAFKENLLRLEEMAVERRRMEADQRAIETRAAAERAADMEKLKENVLRLEMMEAEKRDAEAGAAAERAAAMQQLAGRFETAVGSIVQSVSSAASATEQLTDTVGEVARRAQESSRIAGEAVRQAERTDSRIAELSHAASRIGDVVKLITAIAEQTNLLALNATIEAARAGEAGRGFAVVAQEVKALAAQTAKATDEIGTQIAGMQTATQDSVTAIKEIGGTIGRISEIASTIAAAVEEQGAATEEIARNVQQAADGTAEVAANIGNISRSAMAA